MNWYKRANSFQNSDPTQSNFSVDTHTKKIALTPSIKNKINKGLHSLGNFHETIPVEKIQEVLNIYDIMIVEEDGSKASFFLMGEAECGSKEADSQRATFHLAIKGPDNAYMMTKNIIYMTWCKMQSGKYEIVMYAS